jgi:preprotein translocase subunit SecE
MNKLSQYIRNSVSELKKVVWPTKPEVISHSFTIIFIVLVVAAFIGVIDFFLTQFINYLLR